MFEKRMVVTAVSCLICGLTSVLRAADRPPAYELLPAKTLAYVRIADVRELVDRFDDTSVGRMMQQQELQSLSSQLFAEAEAAFTPVADRLGLSIAELLAIPQGEITLALVTPPSGFPAGVLMMDIEGQQGQVAKIQDVVDAELGQRLTMSKEDIEGTEVTIFEQGDPRFTGLVRFERDDTLVLCSNLDVTKQILAAWDGDEEQAVLRENQDFADVMRRSKGPQGEAPHIRWFVDPISLAKVSFRGNFAAQTFLATFPVIGIDGILALGGSMTFAPEEYDSFVQAHLITAEPRTGALAMLAMESGDPTPEDWVPHDVASYQTMYWDLVKTKDEFATLFDSFQGEDAFQREVVERIQEDLQIDLEETLDSSWGGRISLASWFGKPAQWQNAAYLGGLLLKEDHNMDEVMKAVHKRFEDRLEKKTYGGIEYYAVTVDAPEADSEEALPVAPMQPCFGIVEDYLLVANRPDALEQGIRTSRTETKALQNELDFKLTMSRLRRQSGGKSPGRLVFERPEEGFRMLYDMATAESTRTMLSAGAEGNPFLDKLNTALNDNPLPPFAVLRKYFAPTGTIMTADDSGFHYTSFGLKRK